MNTISLPNFDKTSIITSYTKMVTSQCQYCKSEKCSEFVGIETEKLTVEDYQELLDQTFARYGQLCYRAVPFQTCCPFYCIKCDALNFAITKSQKKVIKKFNRFLEDGHKRKMKVHSRNHQLNNFTNATTIVTDSDRSATGASEPSIDVWPNKTNQRKSKLLRLEKKLQKLQLQGLELETGKQNLVNRTKTLEDLLNDVPQITTCKLKMEFVRPNSHPEWPQLEKMEYELYVKYKTIIHNDDNDDFDAFVNFFVKTPLIPKTFPDKVDNFVDFQSYSSDNVGFGSYHQLYWFDDKLIAVSVIDILPKCVSSLHFFYDPDYQHLSLGTYSLLRDVHLTRQLHHYVPSIRDYYTGYYIPSVQKMCYKNRLVPSYLLSPGNLVWVPFEECSSEVSDNHLICLADPNTDKQKDLVD